MIWGPFGGITIFGNIHINLYMFLMKGPLFHLRKSTVTVIRQDPTNGIQELKGKVTEMTQKNEVLPHHTQVLIHSQLQHINIDIVI